MQASHQRMRFLYRHGLILEICHICMDSLIIYLHGYVNNSKFIKKNSPESRPDKIPLNATIMLIKPLMPQFYIYIYIYRCIYLFILDPEGPIVQQISKVVGLQLIRYCYHVSDTTLARQVDQFVAVSISSYR